MATSIGSEENPIIVRVNTEAMHSYVSQECAKHGWEYLASVEPDAKEDISDLHLAMRHLDPYYGMKIGQNEPCPCGSGKKYKKCCKGLRS